MISVIHDEQDDCYAVWLDSQIAKGIVGQAAHCLAVHKREKTALALARRALINAIMAIEQKERKL